ncbi:MAG TPA: SUMF1/EgtB/PvdO family nonheme iron enzyme [Thermoanaerobaculia bacterium]|nr:SUMF1/EgtB/PvdO family nonheme iron enzyme [Thermoanaerobaculia bacterium]
MGAGVPIAVVEIPGAGTPAPAFGLGRTPVTNREYAAAVARGRVPAPPWWTDPDFSAPGLPVVGVSWDDAAAFCAWLAEQDGGRWRLPTEAEWERAACGGLAAPRTPWGDAVPQSEIPAGALVGPWEAGRGTPNGFGLCDMGTIVHEWCLDWNGPGRRASRGGSWRHAVRWSPPSARSSLPPSYRYSDYGFRALRETMPEAVSSVIAPVRNS